jgi:hypothetical protein
VLSLHAGPSDRVPVRSPTDLGRVGVTSLPVHCSHDGAEKLSGRARRARTGDLRVPNAARCHLRLSPKEWRSYLYVEPPGAPSLASIPCRPRARRPTRRALGRPCSDPSAGAEPPYPCLGGSAADEGCPGRLLGVVRPGQGPLWSGRPDLNGRPPAPEAGTLPSCATTRWCGGSQKGGGPSPWPQRRPAWQSFTASSRASSWSPCCWWSGPPRCPAWVQPRWDYVAYPDSSSGTSSRSPVPAVLHGGSTLMGNSDPVAPASCRPRDLNPHVLSDTGV